MPEWARRSSVRIPFCKMKIALCGIKHSGKTTLGKLLSARLGIPFADTDAELAKREGKNETVRELFLRIGAEEFRRSEAALLGEFSRSPLPRVLALGGGALVNPFFPEAERQGLGLLIWIDVPDEVAFERIKSGGLPPFLSGAADPFAAFRRMNEARRKTFARCADLVCHLDAEGPDSTVEALLPGIREWEERQK